MTRPSYLNFNHKKYRWKSNIDYRQHPEAYYVGKGEQGVLMCNPYKKEILPYWRFKNPEIAIKSSQIIYKMFLKYLTRNEFVGADMARKYLQMGFTRARRYANYKGGRKYAKGDYHLLERGTGDEEKAKSAEIFFQKWQRAEAHPKYKKLKQQWKMMYG
ncbi:MAG: DUF4385 domain-containing protein [Alphaproteobacteria bacterium]|nr:DUF4385 domain-containing protein [Alphaproteobacteria bacterium]